jgi:hydroxymethylglutaryl-CoA lyase
MPQMADSEAVFAGIRRDRVTYAALTPNERASSVPSPPAPTRSRSLPPRPRPFPSATSTAPSPKHRALRPGAGRAPLPGLRVRGYVSCVLGCPYEGEVAPSACCDVSERLLELGCYEISLGDTIGIGTPGSTQRSSNALASRTWAQRLALHCHDTYGQALANILVGLQHGIARFDSAVAGLGGCPYARRQRQCRDGRRRLHAARHGLSIRASTSMP